MEFQVVGLGIAAAGLIPGAHELLPVGGAALAAGGAASVGGALNVAASVSIAGVSVRMMSAGSSVGQRIFNSELKAGATAAGFISDGITFLSPLAAPQQANCSRQ